MAPLAQICPLRAPQLREKTLLIASELHLPTKHTGPQAESSPLISNPFAWSSAAQQPAASSLNSELQETSLTSSEMRSCPPHSAPVNLAKENSGRFFTSPHVTLMVLLSAGGKLQVSHCVKGNDSQDGGFPHVTGACSGSSVCLGELQQPSELMCGNSH